MYTIKARAYFDKQSNTRIRIYDSCWLTMFVLILFGLL